jgi:PelA/Pel-15E family pectate lyase
MRSLGTSFRRLPCMGIIVLLAAAQSGRAADAVRSYLSRPGEWFASAEGVRIAANILSHQAETGGWPKNINTAAAAYTRDRAKLKATFDNRATTDELRFLARSYGATQNESHRTAFERGLDYILQAQYTNGGWPQSHPPGRNYSRHITFNDDCMVRLLELLREVYSHDRYAFVDADRRSTARRAFDRGIECVLKCQVKVDGKPTAWCAQHDERDLMPRPARTFEPVSLSGYESVGIVRLLMSLEEPSPQVVAAIEGAMAWFESVKINGVRQVQRPDARSPTGKNKVVIDERDAPPLWARFYEIGANRPLFVDRDGVPRFALADIGYERRNGYAWLGSWPQALLETEYPRWKQKRAAGKAARPNRK